MHVPRITGSFDSGRSLRASCGSSCSSISRGSTESVVLRIRTHGLPSSIWVLDPRGCGAASPLPIVRRSGPPGRSRISAASSRIRSGALIAELQSKLKWSYRNVSATIIRTFIEQYPPTGTGWCSLRRSLEAAQIRDPGRVAATRIHGFRAGSGFERPLRPALCRRSRSSTPICTSPAGRSRTAPARCT